MEVALSPVKGEDGSYKLGAWVRDDTQGIGTITYVDPNGHLQNTSVRATSSGVPRRSTGVSSARAALSSAVKLAIMSVSITPGATQFTVMPEGPSSLASALVRPITPAFAAE